MVARVRPTLRSVFERSGDIGLAAVMATAAIVEAIGDHSAPRPGHEPLLTLLFTIPLAWRGRWPMAVLLAVFLGIAVANQAAYAEVAGMNERVALVGGRLEAGPGLETGFHVRAWLPAEAAP